MILILVTAIVSASPETLRLSLENARQIALENNPNLAALRETKGISSLSFFRTLAGCLPRPVVNGSYSNREYPGSQYAGLFSRKGYTVTFQIEQVLFDPNVFNSVLQANLERSREGNSYEQAKRQLLLQVDQAYLSFLESCKVLEARQKAFKRSEEYLRLIRAKLDLGSADSLDLLNALVVYGQAELDMKRAEGEKEERKRELLTILGLSGDYVLEVEDIDFGKFPEDVPETNVLIDIALKERPDVKAERKLVQENKAGFVRTLFNFLPSVKFGWYWDYYGEDLPSSLSSFRENADKSSGIFASLTFKFIDYPFGVLIKKKEVRRSSLSFRSRALEVAKEVEQARIEYLMALHELRMSELVKKRAERALELSKARFEVGGVSTLDLFEAEEKFSEAEINYISTLYRLYMAKEKLNFAVGKEVIK